MSLKFAVIYTVDVPAHGRTEDHEPSDKELWQQTEDDKNYEMPDRYAHDDGDYWGWKKGHHRKWHADLTPQQFDAFISEFSLTVSGEGTALGNVGMDMTKAVVFTGADDHDAITEAFVTPHGSEAEVRGWLILNEHHVPACLTDAVGQGYLFKGMKDKRTPWEAVVACLQEQY